VQPVRSAVAVYTRFEAAVLFVIDGSYREIVLLRLFRSKPLHQATVVTRMDRYPGIFAASCGKLRSPRIPSSSKCVRRSHS
jgi:hypothetical protein